VKCAKIHFFFPMEELDAELAGAQQSPAQQSPGRFYDVCFKIGRQPLNDATSTSPLCSRTTTAT
jgi:hypothetical protein